MHKIVKDLVSLIEKNDLEELGYFQFGGSDFVMVFERASNVRLINQPGRPRPARLVDWQRLSLLDGVNALTPVELRWS